MRRFAWVSRWLQHRGAAADGDAADLARPLLDDEAIRRLFLSGRSSDRLGPLPEVTGRQAGEARSVYRGSGTDYEESRAYQPGDEPRFMNWRLSARTGSLQMKVFREERRPGVVLLIDRRGSMRWGTRKRLKLTQAIRVATVIAAAAHQANASVSTLLLDEQPCWSGPEITESGVLNLLRGAAVAAPPLDLTIAQTGFEQALDQLQDRLQPGTTLWLLSDFIDLAAGHRSRLLQLGARARVLAVLLHDPVEQALPAAGRLRFAGPRGAIALDSSDPAVQARYAGLAAAHFDQRQTLLRDVGIACRMLSSVDDDLDGWPDAGVEAL